MIVANLATYPPRRERLTPVIAALAPQVDRLNVVLNEYDAIPEEVTGHANVVPVIPPYDLKDVGKFYPEVAADDLVFLVDDDLNYPADYVAKTEARIAALGPGRFCAGYHSSLYVRPRRKPSRKTFEEWRQFLFRPNTIAQFRRVFWFREPMDAPKVVDQIATNTCIIRGADLPSFAYMESSQRFVDVRLAKWCFEHGITPVALPRERDWLTAVTFEETIFRDFTKTDPAHVAKEIRSYAFRVPGRGGAPGQAA